MDSAAQQINKLNGVARTMDDPGRPVEACGEWRSRPPQRCRRRLAGRPRACARRPRERFAYALVLRLPPIGRSDWLPGRQHLHLGLLSRQSRRSISSPSGRWKISKARRRSQSATGPGTNRDLHGRQRQGIHHRGQLRAGAGAQRAFPGRTVAKALLLLSWAAPLTVIAILWRWIFHGQLGAFNYVLHQLGLINEYRVWLGEPRTAWRPRSTSKSGRRSRSSPSPVGGAPIRAAGDLRRGEDGCPGPGSSSST